MKNNILFITHKYANFQKDQIESIAAEFENVYVLVRYKPLAEIASFLPLRNLKVHAKKFSIDTKNTPPNVHIYPLSVLYLPTNSGYLKLGDIIYKKAEKIIKKENLHFDLIHAHFLWTSAYVATRLKKKYGTPVVLTNHSTHQLTKFPNRSGQWKEKIISTIKNTDKIFVVNVLMKKEIYKMVPEADVEVVPVGFRSALFEAVQKKTNNRILNIGHLEKIKNQQLFIRAIAELNKRGVDVQAAIVGEGPKYQELKRLTIKLGCQNNIAFMGHIPHHKIAEIIAEHTLVCLTSLSEGSPTVMYETLACGKPFVASNVGGDLGNNQ